MSSTTDKHSVADVDFLVDERGNRISLPKDSEVRPASFEEDTLAGTGPSYWWRYGLVALAIVVAILLVLQWMKVS